MQTRRLAEALEMSNRRTTLWARLAGAAAFCLALQLPPSAGAQTPTAAQRQFAATYIAALRSNDLARLKTVYHPATLACINAADHAYFDYLFAGDLQTGASLAGSYELESFKPFSGPAEPFGVPADAFAYAPRPTHVMQINAQTKNRQTMVLLVYLAPANGAWGSILPCPNAKGVQMIAEQARQRRR
jgi:hypothetical protein